MIYIYIYIYDIYLYIYIYIYIYIYTIMETGWSPWEGHPSYSTAISTLLSDIKH